MSPRQLPPEKALRAALEAQDFPRAEAALQDYVSWFKSSPQEFSRGRGRPGSIEMGHRS